MLNLNRLDMKRLLVTFTTTVVIGCSSTVEHKYIVISNDYKDTCEVVAKDYDVENVIVPDGWRNKIVGNVCTFNSQKGISKISNVNKIIAK